jgi:flagellar basal body-associated protein FliL
MLEDNQQNTKKIGQGKKKIAVIVAAVLVIALAMGLAGALLMNGQNPSNSQTGSQNSLTSTQNDPQYCGLK